MYDLNQFADKASSQYVLVGTKIRPKHTAKRKGLTSRREPQRKPKQPKPGSKCVCLFRNLFSIDRTSSDQMVAPLYCGLDKVIFLHVVHPNMYLQAVEQTEAQRKAEEVDEQKSAAHSEEAETAIARKEVLLFVWYVLVQRWNQR